MQIPQSPENILHLEMLFVDLHEALAALENPSASVRYQEKINANKHPDTAARETCQKIDDQVNGLRTMLEAIRNTTRASVDSGNFELRMVTHVEAPTASPESRQYRRHRNISDFNSSSLEEGTLLPYRTPTKILPELNSQMTLCTPEQASNDEEDQSNITSPGMRSSPNLSPSQEKVKQEPRDKSRGSSSSRGIESAREQRYRERNTKVERQNIKDNVRSATSSRPPGDDTRLAGLMGDINFGSKKK